MIQNPNLGWFIACCVCFAAGLVQGLGEYDPAEENFWKCVGLAIIGVIVYGAVSYSLL